MKYLLLSHFNPFYGPTKALMIPNGMESSKNKNLTSALEQVPTYMDINKRNQLFQIYIPDSNISILNLSFEIESKWARGTSEILMISILKEGFLNISEIYGKKLLNFKETLQSVNDAYKGFYVQNMMKLKTNPEINEIFNTIKAEFNQFYNSI